MVVKKKTTKAITTKRKVAPKKTVRISASKKSVQKSSSTLTKEQLYKKAARLGIVGRSKMTKAQLQRVVR